MNIKVLIAGGSGLIGSRLAQLLRVQGAEVRILTRTPQQQGEFHWDPATGQIATESLTDIDAVINLAGAGIADKPWTRARKQQIIESREQAAAVLAKAMEAMTIRPGVYIGASAIGYYGNSGEQLMTEDSTPADHDFMNYCCERWESATDQVAKLGIRIVKFRIGIVLSRKGGALAEILKPLQFGLGTYFSNGRAWWSWIHPDDLSRMFIQAISNESMSDVYNAVAPAPVRNRELVKQVIAASGKTAILAPVPAFALKLALGEMSAAVLNSNRVSSEKMQQTGFEFQFPEIGTALQDVFSG